MATFRPFSALRPKAEYACEVASRPYDVLDSQEARIEAKDKPNSFLRVIKPEIDLPVELNQYDEEVYAKGLENLQRMRQEGILIKDAKACFYVYRLTMDGRMQTGVVGCCSCDEYFDGTIKKHELTRTEKENDRVRHVETQNANAEPVFFSYRANRVVDDVLNRTTAGVATYDFTAEDGVRHELWIVEEDASIQSIQSSFLTVGSLYVADGHHRTAAAARVGEIKKERNPNHDGNEEYNYFLAVLFSDEQLKIYDYNRVVSDLNGKSSDQFLSELKESFEISLLEKATGPNEKGTYSMYLESQWYLMKPKSVRSSVNPKDNLDVSILSEKVLSPILEIKDLRTDKRIDFVGGIRGLNELERRVDSGEMKVAFALFPVSMSELISIADAGEIMPPKTTWFEPKLRSGLFIHEID